MDRTKEYHDKACQLFPDPDDRLHMAISVLLEDMGMTVIRVYVPDGDDGLVKALHFALDEDTMVESLAQIRPVVQ